MKELWQRFASYVTPGVRLLLLIQVAACAAALLGTVTGAFALSSRLALSGPAFWHGRVWLVLTYVLLPSGFVELLINGLMMVWLGGGLERRWSRFDFWTYCLVVTIGVGLVKVLIQPAAASTLLGSTPLVLGLLAAWLRLCRQGSFSLQAMRDFPIQAVLCLVAAISFFMMAASAGLANALVMLAGGLVGWLYLVLRCRLSDSHRNPPSTSERMARLEL
jgi:membrane associated rhomboid family serine protease